MPPKGKGKENLSASKNGKREFALELQTRNPDRAIFRTIIENIPLTSLRPLGNSTLIKYDRVRRLWIVYFTWLYDSEEKALETLQLDAPLPPIQEVKAFIKEAAEHGRSGFKGCTGWSCSTTSTFVTDIGHMRARHVTVPMTQLEKKNLHNYVQTLAKSDHILITQKKEKHTLRECDLIEYLAAVLSPEYRIANNYMRIQICAFSCILYMHGLRPSCLIEHTAYQYMDQVLLWKDMEWIIVGWKDGVGMLITISTRLHYMKNMRLDDSLFLQTTTSTLPRDKLMICSTLYLRAMAIYYDVFEEDIFTLGTKKSKVEALRLPYRLKMKSHALNVPVFTRVRKRNADKGPRVVLESLVPTPNESTSTLTQAQKRVVWRARNKERAALAEVPRVTDPISMSSMTKYFDKAAKILGWKNFTMKYIRYSFAAFMVGKLADPVFKHVMGHTLNTVISGSSYQPPDRHVDISNIRFGLAEDTRTIEHHSSIAWDRKESTCAPPPIQEVLNHPAMQEFLDPLIRAERVVISKFNCLSVEVDEEHMYDPVVMDARVAYCDLMVCYESFLTKSTLELPRHQTPQKNEDTDPVLIVDDKKVREKCRQRICQLETDHPYRAIIAAHPENPLHAILTRLMALLKVDDARRSGSSVCVYCNSDPNKSAAVRNKKHSDHLGLHLWTCEMKYLPDFWRCPVCLELLQCANDPNTSHTLTEEELEALHQAIDQHRNDCHRSLLVALGLKPSVIPSLDDDDSDLEDSITIEEDDREPPSKYGAGCMVLSCCSELRFSSCELRRFFCPICFFADLILKNKRKRDSVYDPRLSVFLSKKALFEHLTSHWANQDKTSIGCIQYDRTFTCGFPQCKGLNEFKCGQMITHLHNVHDYRLVECNIDHLHTSDCFKLPEEGFLTITDATLSLEKLATPLPTTNLSDFRKPAVRKTQLARINAMAGINDNVPGDATKEVPGNAPTDDEVIADESWNGQPLDKFRIWMHDFVKANTDITMADVTELTEFVISENMDLASVVKLSRKDIKDEVGIQWSMNTFTLWRSFVEAKLAL